MKYIALFAVLAAGSAGGAPRPGGGYAVVVSRATHEQTAWREVVDALVRKHGAKTILYDDAVGSCLPELKRLFPRYACFVARPDEAGRRFVVDVHRLTRKLDADPYGDVLWGIVTGYSPADALRIASTAEPLVIRRAGAGTGLDLDLFDAGKWFSEGKAGLYCEKLPGGKPENKQGPADSTKAIVDFLNEEKPALFVTSGHATERDWQIGYSYRNGQFRCRGGKLVGIDRERNVYPVDSPNPKVYLGAGNCLIGHIKRRDCMALVWLGSGGANQFVGYTVNTWFGAMGWGTKDRLLDLPGRHNLAEAFFLANQEIVRRLHRKFPDQADVDLDRYDLETDRTVLGRAAARLGYRTWDKTLREHLGLLWDRDTVAFYGDPAWDARLARRELPLAITLTEKAGTFTFTVRATRDAKSRKPPAVLLPRRLADVKVTAGAEHDPLITDTFLMLAKPADLKAGETMEVVFGAKPLERGEH